MFVNYDHFETKQLKMIYIENRVENFATKYLKFRMRDKILILFNLEVLKTLKNVFNNFNRKLIVINEFRVLRMKNKNFYFFQQNLNKSRLISITIKTR